MTYNLTTLIVFAVSLMNVVTGLVCGLLLLAYPIEVMRPHWMRGGACCQCSCPGC